MKRLIGTLVVSLAVLGIFAQVASAATRFVATPGSDAANDCTAQGLPCATIQHAVEQAEAGDTVDVAGGLYAEEVTIDKQLSLEGTSDPFDPSAPQTIVEGGSGTAITAEAERVVIEHMTATAEGTGTAIGTAGADTDTFRIEDDILSAAESGIRLGAGGEGLILSSNLFEETGVGILIGGTSYSDMLIFTNEFAPSDGKAVVAASGATIEGLSVRNNSLFAPSEIAAQVKFFQGQENEVDGNSFESPSGPQLAIRGDDLKIRGNTFKGENTAGCLRVLGNQGGLKPSEVVSIAGGNRFLECNPYGIELDPEVKGVSIVANEFPGSYDGVLAGDASPWEVTGRVQIRENRFAGTTHLGVANLALGTLDAEQNWWGCNAGPGSAGCDEVGEGVDASDNLRLTALIGPYDEATGLNGIPTGNTIALSPGERAKVAVFLVASGSSIAKQFPFAFEPVKFGASLGTVAPPEEFLVEGLAWGLFTAGSSPGTGSVTMTYDNQAISVPVTIRGTAEGEPPPPPAAERPRPPRLVITRRSLRPAGGRVIVALATCPASCRVATGRATVAVGRRRYRGKVKAPARLGAEATRSIKVLLPPAALRALKRTGSARVGLKVTLTDSLGRRTSRAASVKVTW